MTDIDIGTIRENDTTESVKADADAHCFICRAKGWHWGWDKFIYYPMMLRCPCVDRNRMRDRGAAE